MSGLAVEEQLLDSAVSGDLISMEQLLLSHFLTLKRHLEPRIPREAHRHFGIEDLLQDVLAQAFRDIRQFRPRRDASFLAWLKTIADNTLVDALKKISRKKRGGDRHRLSVRDFAKTSSIANLIDIVCYDTNLPEANARRDEGEKAIQVALASLPVDQCQVLRAHFIEGQEVEQIAQQMGRSAAAVRGLIKRGKANLAEAMGRSSAWLSCR